jgi:anti-sigma regulatory factor (Ser/Thr protein kinase)
LHDALQPLVPPGVAEDARLIASELATNAIQHTGLTADDEFELAAEVERARLHVEVIDGGVGFDVADVATPGADRFGGYGLVIVSMLADRWGTVREPRFGVWFEIDW